MTDEERHTPRPAGRVVSALRVLFGRSLTAEQLQWEWAEYQQAFNDLLQRYSAQLARAAKAEKKRIERLMEAGAQPSHRPVPQSPADRKAELRARAASHLGLPSGRSSSSAQTQEELLPAPPSRRSVRAPTQGSLALVQEQEQEENP